MGFLFTVNTIAIRLNDEGGIEIMNSKYLPDLLMDYCALWNFKR